MRNHKLQSLTPFVWGLFFVFVGEVWGGCDWREAHRFSDRLEEAIVLYREGWGGADDALRKAIEALEAERFPEEEANVARAYLGSAYVASVRLVSDREKPRLLLRGVKQLDRAVKVAPENVRIRLVRVKTFALLPQAAGKGDVVREDLAWLLGRVAEMELSDGCAAEIYYQAGMARFRDRDAGSIEFLEKAVSLAVGEGARERASRMLRLARRQFEE